MAMGRPVSNRYNVEPKVWKVWTPEAQKHFNEVYYALRPAQQSYFHHPAAIALPKNQWETLRWNIAWTCATKLFAQTKKTTPAKR